MKYGFLSRGRWKVAVEVDWTEIEQEGSEQFIFTYKSSLRDLWLPSINGKQSDWCKLWRNASTQMKIEFLEDSFLWTFTKCSHHRLWTYRERWMVFDRFVYLITSDCLILRLYVKHSEEHFVFRFYLVKNSRPRTRFISFKVKIFGLFKCLLDCTINSCWTVFGKLWKFWPNTLTRVDSRISMKDLFFKATLRHLQILQWRCDILR